ncbi:MULTISPECIES: TonB family protein [Hymenobacter]|uniref:TonB family protein n=1 Tax=Hymenobacter profundi TaxID=1982110 RepID=A0ABS6X5M8_9BACT|nr:MULTISPECIES: M56 family metallopeptidase [Hymenobacter]MBW3131152.1 TonB family protein [Hymenobacter profundi]
MTTPQLLNWLLLSTLTLGALWLLYHLALRRERCFQYNRVLLLLAPPLAALLPLVHLPAAWLPATPTAQAPLRLLLPTVTVGASATSAPAVPLLFWVLLLYGAGVALLLGRLSWQLLILWRCTRTLPAEQHAGYTLYRTGGQRPTGSFGRAVYWDDTAPLTAAEAAQVLRHELVHVRQHHTLDRLWLRVWQAVLWPNLFVHLLPRALDLTHEYLADAAAAPSTATDYIRLLARQASGWLGQAPTLAHSFFSSSTLTRIAMLNRSSSVPRRWKQWLALPVCAGLLFVVACEKNTPADEVAAPHVQESKETSSLEIQKVPGSSKFILLADGKQVGGEYTKDEVVPALRRYRSSMSVSSRPPGIITPDGVYRYAQQMPEYPGGMSALLQHIGKSIHYPAEARAQHIEGKVFVRFTVTKDGSIDDVQLMKGIQQKLTIKPAKGEAPLVTTVTTPPMLAMNEEALRVVRELPRWTPGTHNGQPVDVSFTVPVTYALH